MRGRPVAVAIEKRAADAAVQDAFERLVVRLRPPLGHDLAAVAGHEALDAEPLLVGRTAAEAAVLRSVSVLQAFHGNRVHEDHLNRFLPWLARERVLRR